MCIANVKQSYLISKPKQAIMLTEEKNTMVNVIGTLPGSPVGKWVKAMADDVAINLYVSAIKNLRSNQVPKGKLLLISSKGRKPFMGTVQMVNNNCYIITEHATMNEVALPCQQVNAIYNIHFWCDAEDLENQPAEIKRRYELSMRFSSHLKEGVAC